MLTGLSDKDLRGQAFDDEAIIALIVDSDLVIAHNAAFDRPFLERRFPSLKQKAWACSLTQIDWLALGFDGRSLGHLLVQSGRFFEGHRAANDTAALTTLLGFELTDGRTVLSHLLDRCEVDSIQVDAINAPFEAKDMLKGKGYRWDPERRFWGREVDKKDLTEEMDWLDQYVYQGHGKANFRTITPCERFKSRS